MLSPSSARFPRSSRCCIRTSPSQYVTYVPRLARWLTSVLQHFSCGFLSWTQYSLLAAPRHTLSTRFGLTSPLTTGLFYISPAIGFLLGTVIGGWFSDKTVGKFKAIRGERIPQDRLNAGMFAFWVVIPFFVMLQGWGLQCENCSTSAGGLALPIITSFCAATGLLAAFASLNTYCAGGYCFRL